VTAPYLVLFGHVGDDVTHLLQLPWRWGTALPRNENGLAIVWWVASSGTEGQHGAPVVPARLTGGDAVRLHVTLAAGLALCIGAFVIELLRALGGHSFSWMYVFEWPLFAGFGIYMWWNLLQGNDRVPRRSKDRSLPSPRVSDEELDAWNIYLKVMEAAEGENPGRPE
jgi:hypothetical protein